MLVENSGLGIQNSECSSGSLSEKCVRYRIPLCLDCKVLDASRGADINCERDLGSCIWADDWLDVLHWLKSPHTWLSLDLYFCSVANLDHQYHWFGHVAPTCSKNDCAAFINKLHTPIHSSAWAIKQWIQIEKIKHIEFNRLKHHATKWGCMPSLALIMMQEQAVIWPMLREKIVNIQWCYAIH